MLFPLGLFSEQILKRCRYKNESDWKNTWVQDVAILGSSPESEGNTMFIYPDLPLSVSLQAADDSFPRFILLHERMIDRVPANTNWAAVPDEEDLLQVYGRIQTLILHFRNWHTQLYEACTYQCGVDELLHISEQMTENTIYLADMSFKILACADRNTMMEMSAAWRYQMQHGYLPVHVMKGMIETGEFETLNGFHRAATMYSRNFYVPFATRNIFYRNRPQAHLFVVNMIKRPRYLDLTVAENLGSFLESHYFLLEKFSLNYQHNNYESFFRDVIGGNFEDDVLVSQQLAQLDWKPNDRYCLAVLDTHARDDGFRRIIMYHMETEKNLKCLMYRNFILIIQPVPRDSDLAELKKYLEAIRSRYSLSICIGRPFSPFTSLGIHLTPLLQALLLAESGRSGYAVYEEENFAYPLLLDHLRQNEIFQPLTSSRALLLRDYDHDHETEFFQTYLTYLQNDRNIVQTAKLLHIHRNTLTYRLEKIRDLLDYDEEDFNLRMWLLISMTVLN